MSSLQNVSFWLGQIAQPSLTASSCVHYLLSSWQDWWQLIKAEVEHTVEYVVELETRFGSEHCC